jgi:HSP20 family protein
MFIFEGDETMLLTKWKPIENQLLFKNEFDRLFDSFFGDSVMGSKDLYSISPKADIEETDLDYLVSVEVPGIDKKDLKVQIEDDKLTIKGEKKQSKEVKESNYVCSERSYGSFQRTFNLPTSVKSSDISAEYKDGIIKIKLPKAEEAKRKEVEIKVK